MEEHPQARFIVETLVKAGFSAYYAGGWVRDYLLKHPSDDIDIATSASPETIMALFPHTVPIGIAFGIVLVIVDGHQYEVATFRQDLDYQDGRRPTRVEFSTPEEDAKRRDFTINGMFYDPLQEKILDFVHGRADLEAKVIRAIGNPHERIREDRLRMIRAARLACRFGFAIDPATEQAIRAHAKELFPAVAIERICQEFAKGLAFGKLRPMLLMLHDFGLLESIFPTLHGVSEMEMKRRLEPLKWFPAAAPLIAHLLELFPGASLQEQLDLCKRLKVSNHDVNFATFLFHAKKLVQTRSGEDIDWAYLYAHPSGAVSLQIMGAHLDEAHREAFFKEHEARIESLREAIGRIERKDPLVKSGDLAAAGIGAGKQMGLLLKEAERIAINQRIENKDAVINILRSSSLWQNS
ncbi:MAG: CCA tRNA nucleotidyltransferase [Verrucomicrobia bacterium]|nr:CCA tRNA nucleotidyltransferase [Verrucomicrobiota bacterium]